MIEIRDLLLKFNSILLSEETKVNSLITAIQEATGIIIQKEEIQIKRETVYLKIKPIYKNEIFLKKEKIISLLEKSLGKRSPKNII